MAFDPEQHQENKMKMLQALYEIQNEHIEGLPGKLAQGPVVEGAYVIGKRAGFDDAQSERIVRDLCQERLLKVLCAGDEGREVHLTKEGQDAIEGYLHERTFRAKRRKFVGATKEKAMGWAAAGLGRFGSWVGGIIAGAVGATYGPTVVRWIKELLCMK